MKTWRLQQPTTQHAMKCRVVLASGSPPRLLSVAEPPRITRLNADAGDGVAYLLLPRLTLCLCFNATFAGRLCRCVPRLRLCVNRKCKRDYDEGCNPHFSVPVFLRFRARSTVNRCADEERRELLRCTSRNIDLVPHERESNSSLKKSSRLEKRLPFFFGIWPPELPGSSCDSRIDDSPQWRLP